jgi:hypothetical protein
MLECGIATAFGCSIQGEVGGPGSGNRRKGRSGWRRLLMCADTVGYANPLVSRLLPGFAKSSVMSSLRIFDT